MILRTTKKFFQKTIQSFKSLLSGSDYQKLPKDTATPSPLFDSYPHTDYVNAQAFPIPSELDRFYENFSSRWDPENTKKKTKQMGKKKMESSFDAKKQEKKLVIASKNYTEGRREDYHSKRGGTSARLEARRDPVEGSEGGRRDRRLIARKLKELEMIDGSNRDHVRDIEEILHCYSLLTCPVYLDIVDKFFVEVYADFLGFDATLGPSHGPRPGRWTDRRDA